MPCPRICVQNLDGVPVSLIFEISESETRISVVSDTLYPSLTGCKKHSLQGQITFHWRGWREWPNSRMVPNGSQSYLVCHLEKPIYELTIKNFPKVTIKTQIERYLKVTGAMHSISTNYHKFDLKGNFGLHNIF